MLLSGIHKADEVCDPSGAFSLRAGALCSPAAPSSARARTPGGHSRPGWNKTNSVVGRSSNKSVLKRESGCRRGDPRARGLG